MNTDQIAGLVLSSIGLFFTFFMICVVMFKDGEILPRIIYILFLNSVTFTIFIILISLDVFTDYWSWLSTLLYIVSSRLILR